MSDKRRRPSHRRIAAFEPLEERRLMAGEAWGAFPKLIGQDLAVSQYSGVTGAGYSVAVIDTGVDWHHPALGNGFGAGHKVIGGWDFVGNDADPMDTDGHGTGVAGIIAADPFVYNGNKYQGVAPGANIVALRVDDGTYTWNQEVGYVEQALQWIIAHHSEYNIVSINMSIGRGHYTSETAVTIIADEIATLGEMGIFMAASSGNDGVQNPLGIEYPAADPNVYAVGSINVSDVISTITERSANMDILAPGELIPTIYYLPASNSHITLAATGTSFATPFIAGTAALLKQIDPTLTSAEMMSIMKRSGINNYDGDAESPSTGLTWPRLQLNAALGLALTESDDIAENNDTLGTAYNMPFTGNSAGVTEMSLLLGDADCYRFTLDSWADVSFDFASTGSTTPTADLLDSVGNKIKTLSASDSVRLANGTYFLRIAAPAASLDGTYDIAITRNPDDALNNHAVANASTITLVDDQGSVTGSKLLANLADFFKFTITGVCETDFSIDYAGPSAMPAAQLLDSGGNYIADFTAGYLAKRLLAGTYVIKVLATSDLSGTYGATVTATPYVEPGINGSANAIAYDSAGLLHFAWYDESEKNLKYATRDIDKIWSRITTVDAANSAGQFVSLALDSTGLPGLAYYDAWNGDLKYAHFDGSAWDVRTIDAGFTTGYYPSLKYTASDQAVISYYYRTGGDLKLAIGAGLTWSISTIDSAGDVGRYSSLAANLLTGRWSVAYEDTGNGTFKYADQTKTAWAPVTFDATTKIAGGYISLAFSPKTKLPSISYYDAYNADLKFASYSGTKWSTQAIASKNSVGLYSTLQIDGATGDMDILYYARNTDALCRAHRTGSTWTLTQLLTGGGRWISRAYSIFGQETVSYLTPGEVIVADL